MTTRAAPKAARPTPKSSLKAPGKGQGKGDKQTANVLEIVPGKFNETDWISLIETDETENFIADIFDNIWKDVSDQIQQIYLRRQLLSFTLMRAETALTTVVQWAFLERDESQPANGNFWTDDDEPIPCLMDNWGEGVVPACREERTEEIDLSSICTPERSPSAPSKSHRSIDNDPIQRPSTGSSHSDVPIKQVDRISHFDTQNKIAQSTEIDVGERVSKQPTYRSSLEKKPLTHDILVIETQPPKLEPLGELFQRTSTAVTAKHRRVVAPKGLSQFGSDTFRSLTNGTESTTTVTKSIRKAESKIFDEQHIEEIIAKAPAASHSMLKSILSRPPGYRELELNDDGNVVSMIKIDPDKLATKSIRMSCDIVKPRKSKNELRAAGKKLETMKLSRSDPKFAPVKLVLPEQSTEVGDLIHPVPGVLYEDSRLKKGDPKRYQTGMARYINFHDETRSLKPIAQSSDFAILRTANDLLRLSNNFNSESDDDDHDLQIPKLHRLPRIPPITSASTTSST
ncbi:unnamed protein product [Adineta ricciae]|uniref:Uncharacterized protein n=1 Tax=Adineta ricciae TaxID=249248 RepID=A0A813RMZ9_ADIRI|nr:unnamed protein product [Adineta ricciae]CAF1433879.1 unnamed protein product [Adineta ricciae]